MLSHTLEGGFYFTLVPVRSFSHWKAVLFLWLVWFWGSPTQCDTCRKAGCTLMEWCLIQMHKWEKFTLCCWWLLDGITHTPFISSLLVSSCCLAVGSGQFVFMTQKRRRISVKSALMKTCPGNLTLEYCFLDISGVGFDWGKVGEGSAAFLQLRDYLDLHPEDSPCPSSAELLS